jgi:hypothetical protein
MEPGPDERSDPGFFAARFSREHAPDFFGVDHIFFRREGERCPGNAPVESGSLFFALFEERKNF